MADQPRRVTRELPCKLTDDEKLALGDALASALVEHDEKQEEKKKITADQQPIKKLVKALQNKLKSGTEMRTVPCEVHEGPGYNVRIIRADTKQVVEERPLNPEERQTKLAGGDWMAETEKAAQRGKGGGGGGDDEDELDEDDGKVIPFGGRTTVKKAARKPKGGGGKGKGRKR